MLYKIDSKSPDMYNRLAVRPGTLTNKPLTESQSFINKLKLYGCGESITFVWTECMGSLPGTIEISGLSISGNCKKFMPVTLEDNEWEMICGSQMFTFLNDVDF
jgi:hypothetical protein